MSTFPSSLGFPDENRPEDRRRYPKPMPVVYTCRPVPDVLVIVEPSVDGENKWWVGFNANQLGQAEHTVYVNDPLEVQCMIHHFVAVREGRVPAEVTP